LTILKSEDQEMSAVGVIPLGPTAPEYASPLTVRTSKYDSVSKLSTTIGAAMPRRISRVHASSKL
jgi:hypothetical protein